MVLLDVDAIYLDRGRDSAGRPRARLLEEQGIVKALRLVSHYE